MIRDILNKEIKKFGDFNIWWNGDERGDYSTNVVDPKVAEKIKEELSDSEYISKIETSDGFVNFWLSEKGLEEGLNFAWPKLSLGQKGRVQVEFISANPTGELHIGHGRGGFYGDVLSNILKAAGHEVDREYYINDAKVSTQIRELGKTVLGKGEAYLSEYLKDKISAFAKVSADKKNSAEAGYLMASEIQKDNEKFIEKDLGIKFDKWFSEEKSLYEKKEPDKTLELLKKKNLVYEKEGAVWLKTSEYGDEEDRVLVRSDGVYSYFLGDIAYHADKFKRGYGKVIDIWGADHQGHEKRMYAAKKALDWEGELAILVSQLVTLRQGKLSKRKGEAISLKDLLNEVGLDVLRWFFLEKALPTHMDFDMDLAKEQSKKNPVYYVQYSHARACSILNKSEARSTKSETISNFRILNSKHERSLILKLTQFPEIIEDISKDYQVHHLTTYVYELAKTFTDFYENARVLDAASEELKKSRLALVYITRQVLEKVLSLLGITAPKKM